MVLVVEVATSEALAGVELLLYVVVVTVVLQLLMWLLLLLLPRNPSPQNDPTG